MDGRNGMSGHNGQKGLNSFTLGFGDDYHGKKVFQIIQAGVITYRVLILSVLEQSTSIHMLMNY